jgi:hypothetical protein
MGEIIEITNENQLPAERMYTIISLTDDPGTSIALYTARFGQAPDVVYHLQRNHKHYYWMVGKGSKDE